MPRYNDKDDPRCCGGCRFWQELLPRGEWPARYSPAMGTCKCFPKWIPDIDERHYCGQFESKTELPK